MEYVIFASLVILFLVGLVVYSVILSRRNKQNLLYRLRKDYGNLPTRKVKPENIDQGTAGYFHAHQGENFYIDDITWNDLEMDEIFNRMNYSNSAAGEEYLYDTLRHPAMNAEEIRINEEAVDYFMSHEAERIKLQYQFVQLGRTGKYSLYKYLDHLDELGKRSNAVYYLDWLLYAASVGMMFFSLPYGIALLAIILLTNFCIYSRRRSEIEPYIISFEYILRTLNMSLQISGKELPVMNEEAIKIRENRSRLRSVSGLALQFIGSNSGGNMASDLGEMMGSYLKMATHLDIMIFNRMLSQLRGHKDSLDVIVTGLGKIELQLIIGSYRKSMESFCVPTLKDSAVYEVQNVIHPLIDHAIANSIHTEKGVLLTGSNASGKSTFLKTIALSVIMSQTVHTVTADSYTGFYTRVLSSMSLRDSLGSGDSYYMVEIKSLKRILDEIDRDGLPVFCFVDEVLRGTNTVERIAASSQIMAELTQKGTFCFAATHDVELTYLLEKMYHNFHFEESIEGKDIFFNYKLEEGRAQTRNAIRLLDMLGYDESMTGRANRMAEHFMKENEWKMCLKQTGKD